MTPHNIPEEHRSHQHRGGSLKSRIEVMGRQGRRCKQLLDDLKEMTGYWKLKEEALDHTRWRICFGRGYGPVVRQTTGIKLEIMQVNSSWMAHNT
jgi:hypothetical protein